MIFKPYVKFLYASQGQTTDVDISPTGKGFRLVVKTWDKK